MTPRIDPDLARDFEPLRVAFAVCALLLGLLVAASGEPPVNPTNPNQDDPYSDWQPI